MKKTLALLLLLINSYTFSQSYPHISELRGIEDSLATTHLFYRYISPYSDCWSKNIYHLDLLTSTDTLFISDYGIQVIPEWGCQGDYVNDYEFFNNDPAKFIYCGYNLNIDPVALLRRFDGDIQLEAFALNEIEISKQNENFVYVSAGPGFFKSTDGGYNFERKDTMQFIDESIISLSKNIDTQIYGIDDSKLVRSENDGLSYLIVDNSTWRNDSELFYDNDQSHIYGRSVAYNFSTQTYSSKIYMSNDNGNPFTWNTIIEYDGKVWFTLDQNVSGEIYYSAGNRIFQSTNFGNSFLLYKQLDRNITGLYKKSGTDLLYASTPLKIYEITPDTIQVIKSLPIPEDAFAWLPLNLGDMWVTYHEQKDSYGDSSKYFMRSEVIGYKLFDGKVYTKEIQTKTMIDSSHSSGTSIKYFRVDSTNGFVYRSFFINDSLLDFESFLMDLIADVGDTIPFGYGAILESEEPVTQYGVSSLKRIFRTVPPREQQFELVKGFGVVYDTVWTSINYVGRLVGCKINGVLYGDTTTVGVEDEKKPIALNFELEQNYPNPFNPSTKIRWQSPVGGWQTIKVYDVLGNEVATLVNEEKPAGTYEVEFSSHSVEGRNLPSGVYFYQLIAKGPETSSGQAFIQTKKMVYLK